MDLDINLTSSCRITVLLVPVYPIKQSVFIRYVELIREFTTIRLSDVTPGNNSGQVAFNNMNFQQGQIHFQFTTRYSDRGSLIDIQPHRRLFGVIGIMDCQEWKEGSLKNGYQQYIGSVDKYPSPIVTRCFAFDPTENQADDTKGLIMIPDVGDKKFYVATLLCDFASDILTQFSVLAKDIGQLLQSESPLRDTNYANSSSTNQRHSVPQQPYSTTNDSSSRHSVSAGNLLPSSSYPSSSPSTGHTSRLQKRAPGRIKKLYADFYLLSGRLPDALGLYIQAMDMTKITSDHIWLACSMEGYVCTTLLLEQLQLADTTTSKKPSKPGTSTTDSAQTSAESHPSPETTFTISFVLEHYSTLLQLYLDDIRNSGYRHTQYTTNLIYAEACIKVARFLLSMYLNGVLGSSARFLLVQGSISSFDKLPPPSISSPLSSPSLPETPISMNYFTAQNQPKPQVHGDHSIQRRDIGLWTTKVWESSMEHLDLIDQIHLMAGMAFIYNSIGYYRKTAWLKYQSIQHLLPALLYQQSKSSQYTKVESSIKTFPNIDRQSILVVLKWICKVYGIVVFDPPDDYVILEKQHLPATMNQANSGRVYSTTGWPSLQLVILRKAITIAESLQSYTDMLYYATTLMKNMYHYIPKEEQIRLSNSIQRIGTLQRRPLSSAVTDNENDSQEQGVNYWGVNIVTSIKAIQAISRKRLYQHPLSKEMIMNAMLGTEQLETNQPPDNANAANKDPFIYNPFTQKEKEKQKEQILLVKDEVAEFQVSLINPFGFDLELQNIQLCTYGVPFQGVPHTSIVPAYGASNVCVSGIPKDTGTLLILGCTIKIVGFVEQEFLLNEDTPESQESVTVEQKEFNVIAEQPLMKIKSTSLLQGAIMLFEGEREQVRIILENIGNTPVTFLAFSFTAYSSNNSNMDISSGILGSNLSMEQRYDLERSSLDKKVFMWQGKVRHNNEMIGESVWLPPGAILETSLDIYGRRGCTHGTVKADYGYLNDNNKNQNSNQSQLSAAFYTRQLYIPILITVHRHLKLQHWDLLYMQLEDASQCKDMDPITDDFTSTNKISWNQGTDSASIEQILASLSRRLSDPNASHIKSGPHGQNEYCLATIDIQNRWSFPFHVIFSIDNSDDGKGNDAIIDVNSIIQAGTTTRMLLPIKRFILPDNVTSKPIILKAKKQFVCAPNQMLPTSLSSLSLIEQQSYWKSQLELFWYRENLLQRVKARWVKHEMGSMASHVEDGNSREGELDLRECLCLTPAQLSILKIPNVVFALKLEGTGVKQVGSKRFICQSGQRMLMTITVINKQLKKATKFILRVQPIQNLNDGIKELDLSRDELLMEGQNQVILPEIQLNQQAQHTIPLYFLAKGQFEFLYHAQDVASKSIYYDQENTLVDVVDTLDLH